MKKSYKKCVHDRAQEDRAICEGGKRVGGVVACAAAFTTLIISATGLIFYGKLD